MAEAAVRLVPTWAIVELMVLDLAPLDIALTRVQARHTLYDWAHRGRITNHGGRTRDAAMWDLCEIIREMGLKLPECTGSVESVGHPH